MNAEEYACEVARWLESLGPAMGALKPGDGLLAVEHNTKEVARAFVSGVRSEACARALLTEAPGCLGDNIH